MDQVSFSCSPFLGARGKPAKFAPDSSPLLENVSLSIQQGDRVAIVGPSGAGKTTLLRLLNRLSEPTRGRIYFNGQDYTQIPVVQLRQHISLVLQESKLLGMTVQQALEYPLRLRNLSQQEIQQRTRLWLERLHIPSDWLDRTELQLSVGQRQLVAIARALVSQPTVLLLDEPTSALDAGRSQALITTLANLHTTQNATVIMVNHQLELAQRFCDRLIYLQQGNILKDCPTQSVDWVELRQNLVNAEAQQAEEWGD